MVHNEPRPTLPGEVCPDPLNKHAYAKARLREKLEVNPRPREPGCETGHLKSSALQDGEALSDDGHVPFIEVAEGSWGRLTGNCAANQLSGVSTLLDCDLRYARQRPAILVERCGVSDDEYFRVARYREIVLNTHAASPIGGHF